MGQKRVQDLEKQRRDEERAAEAAAARRAEQAARAEERRRVQVSRASTPDSCTSTATGHVRLPSVTAVCHNAGRGSSALQGLVPAMGYGVFPCVPDASTWSLHHLRRQGSNPCCCRIVISIITRTLSPHHWSLMVISHV